MTPLIVGIAMSLFASICSIGAYWLGRADAEHEAFKRDSRGRCDANRRSSDR